MNINSEHNIVSYTEQFVCFPYTWLFLWSQSRTKGGLAILWNFTKYRRTGIFLWNIYGTICCECVSICVLGMFLALCFRINTCCGPLRSSSPMHVRSTLGTLVWVSMRLVRFLNSWCNPRRLKENFFLRPYSDALSQWRSRCNCGSLETLQDHGSHDYFLKIKVLLTMLTKKNVQRLYSIFKCNFVLYRCNLSIPMHLNCKICIV